MREERLLSMVSLLKKRGYMNIGELAEAFNVSTSTVRRDLAELSARNLVASTKSGVVPIAENKIDTPLNYRSRINSLAKAAIARSAISLVREGDTVYLDSSSTVLQLAAALRSMRSITVVTNGLLTVKQFRGTMLPVYLIGGEISELSYGFYGPIAEEALRMFHFDIAFFSPVGVTARNDVVEIVEEAATIRRAAMRQARSNVLLFDHTKIGVDHAFSFAKLDEFDHLVTDGRRYTFDTKAAVHYA